MFPRFVSVGRQNMFTFHVKLKSSLDSCPINRNKNLISKGSIKVHVLISVGVVWWSFNLLIWRASNIHDVRTLMATIMDYLFYSLSICHSILFLASEYYQSKYSKIVMFTSFYRVDASSEPAIPCPCNDCTKAGLLPVPMYSLSPNLHF